MPAELTREFLEEVVRQSGWAIAEVESLSLEGEGIARLGALSFRGVEMLMYLDLANNKLSSLQGIEDLPCLVTGVFRANRLSSMREVERLAELPNLRDLDLRLNPIMTPASTSRLRNARGCSSLGETGDTGPGTPRNRVLRVLPSLLRLDGVAVVAGEASGSAVCAPVLRVGQGEPAGKRRACEQTGTEGSHDDVGCAVVRPKRRAPAGNPSATRGATELQPERSYPPMGRRHWERTCQERGSRAPRDDRLHGGFGDWGTNGTERCDDPDCGSSGERDRETVIDDRGPARRRSRSGDMDYNNGAPPHGGSDQVVDDRLSHPELDPSLHRAAEGSLKSIPSDDDCLRATMTERKTPRADRLHIQSHCSMSCSAPSGQTENSRRRPRPSWGGKRASSAADNGSSGNALDDEEKLLALSMSSGRGDQQEPFIPLCRSRDAAPPADPTSSASSRVAETWSVAVGRRDHAGSLPRPGSFSREEETLDTEEDDDRREHGRSQGRHDLMLQGDPRNDNCPRLGASSAGEQSSGVGCRGATVLAELSYGSAGLEQGDSGPELPGPRSPEQHSPYNFGGNFEPSRGISEPPHRSCKTVTAHPAPSLRGMWVQSLEVTASDGASCPVDGEKACEAAESASEVVEDHRMVRVAPQCPLRKVGDNALGCAALSGGSKRLGCTVDPDSTVRERGDTNQRGGNVRNEVKIKETCGVHAAPPCSLPTNNIPPVPEWGPSLPTAGSDAPLDFTKQRPGISSVSVPPKPMPSSSSAARAVEAFRRSTLLLRLPDDDDCAPLYAVRTGVASIVRDSGGDYIGESHGEFHERVLARRDGADAARNGGGDLAGGDGRGGFTSLTTDGHAIVSDPSSKITYALNVHNTLRATKVDCDRLAGERNVVKGAAVLHSSPMLPPSASTEGHSGTAHPGANAQGTRNQAQGEHEVLCKECGGVPRTVNGDERNSWTPARTSGITERELEEKWWAREKEFEARWMAREREFDARWVAREREFDKRRRDDAEEFARGMKTMLLEAHEALISANTWLAARLDALEGSCPPRLGQGPTTEAERVAGSRTDIASVAVRGNLAPVKAVTSSSASSLKNADGPERSAGVKVGSSRSAPASSRCEHSPPGRNPGSRGRFISESEARSFDGVITISDGSRLAEIDESQRAPSFASSYGAPVDLPHEEYVVPAPLLEENQEPGLESRPQSPPVPPGFHDDECDTEFVASHTKETENKVVDTMPWSSASMRFFGGLKNVSSPLLDAEGTDATRAFPTTTTCCGPEIPNRVALRGVVGDHESSAGGEEARDAGQGRCKIFGDRGALK